MSHPSLSAVPQAREWRARLRRTRKAHRRRSMGELLEDIYMVAGLVLIYGGALVSVIRGHLRSAGAAGATPESYWMGAAVLAVGAGLVWQGLRALGPLLATGAEQIWGVSAPVDRGGWLRPRLFMFLLVGTACGAIAGGAVTVLAAHTPFPLRAVLAGGLGGSALVAFAVVAQRGAERLHWPRIVGTIGTGGGILIALAVVGANAAGGRLPAGPPMASGLAIVGFGVAAAALFVALHTLPQISAAKLGAGAQLGDAAVTATVALDPSLFSDVAAARRWRRVGEVRGRPFLRFGGRVGTLLQAEIRRLVRRPGALGAWAILVLAQYAVAVIAPSVAIATQVLGAYLATKRLAAGLRTVSRSRALRRSLGDGDVRLHLIHLVIPTLGATAWWFATVPTSGGLPWILHAMLLAGIVIAVYRVITRPSLSYSGLVVDTPFGPFPVDLVRDMTRGPDVLAAVMLIRLLWEL